MRPLQRFTRNARVAVMLAGEEARELCDREAGSQHLLLGVLQAAGADLSTVFDGFGLTAEGVRARLTESSTGAATFDEDADALSTIGIDLRAVRDSVARTFGSTAFDEAVSRSGRRRRRRGHMSWSYEAKKVLDQAQREALAHKDSEVQCEHLLLGIMRSGEKTAIGLITEHVFTSQLRAAVVELLGEAA